MIVDITVSWAKKLKSDSKVITDLIGWKNDKQRIRIDLRHLSPAEVAKLRAVAEAEKGHGWKSVTQAIDTMAMMKANPSGTPVPSLKALAHALTEHFKPTPNRWCFVVDGAHRFPYYVNDIRYTPAKHEKEWTRPAYVTMELKASQQPDRTITWHEGDIQGLTVPQLLAEEGCQTESKILVSLYKAEMETHARYVVAVGSQMHATGVARSISTSWFSSHSNVAMEREGVRAKVIIDDGSESDEDSNGNRRRRRSSGGTTVSKAFWNKTSRTDKPKRRGEDDDDDDDDVKEHNEITDDDVVVLPEHPWVHIFDLKNHQFLEIHVNDLEPYKYNTDLGDKLVLPEDTMDVLYALVRGADEVMEDIVEGKTGGTIVIATGPPGTGKTLTAELFSEIVQKPLYTVQCSQLGMTPDSLEKELGIVLNRATRWHALLLIDEADVYVRERGNEIEQNAIVGIWLRVLEYYRGILFMTSNKATVIDDAVMSRATAWVRYELPTAPELTRIWTVLGEQYQMGLDIPLITKLVEKWPHATGRNVKNMLKLAKQLVPTKKHKSLLDLFDRAARFLDVPDKRRDGTI